jgi:hypothetical protein
MKINTKTLIGCLGLTILFAIQAGASLTTYTSRPSFNAQGTIVYNAVFTDFGTGFGFPGNSFTRGDVTYRSLENLTWGSSSGYTTTETLIGNNYWTPVLADIATGPQYGMFGFDIGTYNTSPITIEVYTSAGTYTYPSLTIADSASGLLEFRGFVASAGEYFTGFNITADNGHGNLPGITHVTLGNAGVVPEPSTFIAGALLAVPFGVSAIRKLRKSRTA